MTIKKAIKRCFRVALFVMICKVGLQRREILRHSGTTFQRRVSGRGIHPCGFESRIIGGSRDSFCLLCWARFSYTRRKSWCVTSEIKVVQLWKAKWCKIQETKLASRSTNLLSRSRLISIKLNKS